MRRLADDTHLQETKPLMFSSEDFRIESVSEFLMFLPVAFFLGLVAPFLLLAYKIGFVMDVTGWLD